MAWKSLATGLVVTSVVAACASKHQVASAKFDGTHVGTIELTPDSGPACFKQPSARMVVLNGNLDYNYADGVALYHTEVDEDGSFGEWVTHKLNGKPLHLKGKIVGDSIVAITENNICKNELNLKRVKSE
jgi:hypothetical protein